MRNARPTSQALNRYPTWKYIILIIAIITLTLSALPTWYGEKPAVLLPHQSTFDIGALSRTLLDNNLTPLAIEQDSQGTQLIFEDEDQQAKAAALLNAVFSDDDSLTFGYVSVAPHWLQQLGFTPIKLGLDLRGGVQFLLKVDIETALFEQRDAIEDALRAELRAERITGVRFVPTGDELMLVNTSDKAREIVHRYLRQHHSGWTLERGSRALVVAPSDAFITQFTRDVIQQNLTTLRERIEELGITEALVQRQGEHHIRIELPGVQDPTQAKQVIGATASLAFYEVLAEETRFNRRNLILDDEQGNPIVLAPRPILTGDHIVNAQSGSDEMGRPEVNISLDSAGGRVMQSHSGTNIGKPMATVYREYHTNEDGSMALQERVISIATIQTQLGSQFRITGAGSRQDAQQLALLLRAGSLTAPITIVEERTIGASLGSENIRNGFSALALGLSLTLAFMACWYRRLGWVANAALLLNMVSLLGLIALLPGTVLTLPGIAGIVLTVGMAVDTNVLIFERIRDKLQSGRSYAQAIDLGFSSAFRTILDANLTSMITALVLFSIGSGPIKGFALTLGLGLVTSMFTGIFVSRAVINLLWGQDTRRDVRI
ncbi:protein translocase subunit SecD [Thaumasiovibrio subtropicus]|uniref:protein translocase subunit SecD n=1 Tax=Thaumasiovibrio subtropicus TaxID=1891207 RepID=UPI000B35E208|nr:protein translocase subunit SecD [Thaumasiovibrio subtropicus]